MTDRALLELAAKAAGMNVSWDTHDPDYCAGVEGMFLNGERSPDNSKYWTPLTDDGDALRLAVQIGFYIDIERPCGQVDVGPGRAIERFQFDDLDAALVATRRAIVRAAAEIGKAVVD